MRGNRKSQTGSFNISVSALLHPLEGFKKSSYIFLSDTNAGVPDRNVKLYLSLRHPLSGNRHSNLTLLGIFHCISQKVGNNLTYPHLIAVQMHRRIRGNVHFQLKCLFLRLSSIHLGGLNQNRSQIIIHGKNIHFTAFDFGKVQNIIN